MRPLIDLVNHRPVRLEHRGQEFYPIRTQFTPPNQAYVMHADQDYAVG